jgi:A/G-specific adenine glycosylase
MLQQTQVVTVKAYFARFLQHFPTVAALAAATLDDVLGLWSGLGYYTRARNLHACAQAVVQNHGGAFPRDAQTLSTLPGIGRSTAAAIASLCFAERSAILDANVKRVLTRVLGFDDDLALAASERKLWQLAGDLLPAAHEASGVHAGENRGANFGIHSVANTAVYPGTHPDMPRYTQGMMDLGATVCTPKRPACGLCPVRMHCKAAASGEPERYPVRTRKLKRSSQSLWLLWAHTPNGAVWLSKRPTPGVWAGLHCFPLFDSEDALLAAVPEPLRKVLEPQPAFVHVLTHKDLHLHPRQLLLPDTSLAWGEGRWVAAHDWSNLGLPAPIRKMLGSA